MCRTKHAPIRVRGLPRSGHWFWDGCIGGNASYSPATPSDDDVVAAVAVQVAHAGNREPELLSSASLPTADQRPRASRVQVNVAIEVVDKTAEIRARSSDQGVIESVRVDVPCARDEGRSKRNDVPLEASGRSSCGVDAEVRAATGTAVRTRATREESIRGGYPESRTGVDFQPEWSSGLDGLARYERTSNLARGRASDGDRR